MAVEDLIPILNSAGLELQASIEVGIICSCVSLQSQLEARNSKDLTQHFRVLIVRLTITTSELQGSDDLARSAMMQGLQAYIQGAW